MGEWAAAAEQRFKNQSGKRRLDEELELLRHHKTVAGAETIWANLVRFILNEAGDFNRRMGREFLVAQFSENKIEVGAPKMRLTVELDFRTPTIDFTFNEPYPNNKERDSGVYRFLLKDEEVTIVGQNDKDTPLSIETVGGELLDPLVV